MQQIPSGTGQPRPNSLKLFIINYPSLSSFGHSLWLLALQLAAMMTLFIR